MNNKKCINIVFFIVIFIIILLITISKPLNDLDEMWNYNIARNIANGLIPYKDISMITSPLLAMITAIFLKVIANEMIITRILSAVLSTLVLYSLYKTMEILKFNKSINYLVISVLLIVLKDYFCLDYNWAVALMGIIILNLELKNIEKIKEKNYKYEFFIGCLVGIAICFKQSIGAVIAIISMLYNIIYLNKEISFKEYIKKCLIRMCGILLTIGILLFYLLINDALYGFIDYCILGIKTFSNSMSYMGLIKGKNIFVKITSILIPIMYLSLSIKILYNLIKERDIKILYTILTYSISLFMITFPIANDNHFLIGSLPSLVLLAYSIKMFISKIIKKEYKIINILIKATIFIIIISNLLGNVYTFFKLLNNDEYIIKNKLKHFEYIPVSNSINDMVKSVDNYIVRCESKVYILDSMAVVFMIPLDIYNKDYDMFNLGNFGGRGEQGKIQDLQNENDITVLIVSDKYQQHWQTPLSVIEYVKNNLVKIDNIGIYDVYVKE